MFKILSSSIFLLLLSFSSFSQSESTAIIIEATDNLDTDALLQKLKEAPSNTYRLRVVKKNEFGENEIITYGNAPIEKLKKSLQILSKS